MPVSGLTPQPPASYVRLAEVLARRVGHDELGARACADDDRVLAEDAPEADCFVAVHAVNDPRRLAPGSFRVILVADAGLDAVHAENEQIAHHLVALLVDLPREEHRPRVICREHGERLLQQIRQRTGVGDGVAVERHADQSRRRAKLVDRGQVAAQKVLIHGDPRLRYSGEPLSGPGSTPGGRYEGEMAQKASLFSASRLRVFLWP